MAEMKDIGTEEQVSTTPAQIKPSEEMFSDPVDDREMSCPVCGSSMPDLKGGKASICPNCGFKDSCCF